MSLPRLPPSIVPSDAPLGQQTIEDIARSPPSNPLTSPNFPTRLWAALKLLRPAGPFSQMDFMELARFTVRRVHRREHGYHMVPVADYWKYRELIDRTYHPDLGEPIPWLARPSTSLFAYSGLVGAIGYAVCCVPPATRMPFVMGWTAAGVSYAISYSSSNKCHASPFMRGVAPKSMYDSAGFTPFPALPSATRYNATALDFILLASATMITGSFALRAASVFGAGRFSIVKHLAPLAVGAGVCGAVTTVAGEAELLQNGLFVTDVTTHEELAMPSVGAGWIAVGQSAASRAVQFAGTAAIAPLVALSALKFFGRVRSPVVYPAVAALSTFAAALVASPVAIALLPTRCEVDVSELHDAAFDTVHAHSQQPVTKVMFYRGL
jgi:hypothetical protein